MAWAGAVGSPSEIMKSIKDEGSRDVLEPVCRELSTVSQDLAISPGTDRGSLKRQHQSLGSRVDDADDDEIVDDQAQASEKKRRLTPQQVRYLETNFETESKLGPERKAVIARHLGLRPRQVAIWFQNRRARWKNKQLEQDYEFLKDKYEALLQENEKVINKSEVVLEENKRLQAEVARITALLQKSKDGSSDLTDAPSEKRKEQQPPEDASLVSAKSELTSPTKSEDQSDVQDSGRSYATPGPQDFVASEDEHVIVVANMNEAAMKICSYPVVKLEDPSAFLTSEDLYGNMFNPFLFQHLAANGVCLEEGREYLHGWDDQFPSFLWFPD